MTKNIDKGNTIMEKFKLREPSDETVGKAFQMDDYGNFRIVVHGHASNWVPYNSIASVQHNGKYYIGVSAFYEGSLPIECVLQVSTTDIVKSEEHSST